MGRAENKVAKRLLKLCDEHDVFAEKVHNEGETGCPDYILTFPSGKVKRVETKSDSGRVSPKQDWYHRQLAKRWCFVFVPSTPEDVDMWFDQKVDAGWMVVPT
jgi:hypothetical protein